MQPYDLPRPYGLLGLVLSLAAIGVLALTAFAAMGGAVFAVAALVGGSQGAASLADLFAALDVAALQRAQAPTQRAFFGIGCLLYLGGVFAILALARWRGGPQYKQLVSWTPARIWPGAQTFTLLLIACLAYHLIAGLILRALFPDFAVWLFIPTDPVAMLLSFVMIVVLAPLAEELLFRGWMFTAIRARFAAATTVGVCTLVFAVAHWDATGLYPLAVLVPGWVLSELRERTGSARPAVAAHALYNGVGWVSLLMAGLISR